MTDVSNSDILQSDPPFKEFSVPWGVQPLSYCHSVPPFPELFQFFQGQLTLTYTLVPFSLATGLFSSTLGQQGRGGRGQRVSWRSE